MFNWGQIFYCARRWAGLGTMARSLFLKLPAALSHITVRVNPGHDSVDAM